MPRLLIASIRSGAVGLAESTGGASDLLLLRIKQSFSFVILKSFHSPFLLSYHPYSAPPLPLTFQKHEFVQQQMEHFCSMIQDLGPSRIFRSRARATMALIVQHVVYIAQFNLVHHHMFL